jgi:hypothetical protein
MQVFFTTIIGLRERCCVPGGNELFSISSYLIYQNQQQRRDTPLLKIAKQNIKDKRLLLYCLEGGFSIPQTVIEYGDPSYSDGKIP